MFFGQLKNIDGQYKCLPSKRNWQLASGLENDLKCFYYYRILFSGTSYPTSNLFLCLLCDIRMRLMSGFQLPNMMNLES